ncbi:uncharacterized protein B0I36DRAFT_250248 [Microdochium trichocladiopsis]|uniref:NmrA-like domain-containing protein n=1 Tax=Microdochium trichocladiopsis TaxID=1682393 RepID=A0A9P9BL82_9PEZI|nr:uncharacterized protein B0I36DRAFT_250248 [Microdochium trichocladiopsis]KAH7024657.1 hypothetical protein B0I36DRAFT_250248 [Microdochium trichocladiopsis]
MSYVKNVAIVGANGTVGTFITDALLKTGKHTITALTRSTSGNFPFGVKLATIDYDKPETIVSALKDQQVLIITMGVGAPPEQQLKLIDAAADAGVPYVMPNDWGYDVSRDDMYKESFFHLQSKTARAHIEERGVSSWISLVCGFWYEFSLGQGTETFGIDSSKKEAILFDGGNTQMDTSTLSYVGKTVAALLSLPEKKADAAATTSGGKGGSLEQFKNNYVRVAEFSVTQREMLDSVQRVSGTTDKDWKISHETTRERYAHASGEVMKGNYALFVTAMYSRVWFPDGSPVYHDKGLHDELLGLQKEELDVASKRAVDRGRVGYNSH